MDVDLNFTGGQGTFDFDGEGLWICARLNESIRQFGCGAVRPNGNPRRPLEPIFLRLIMEDKRQTCGPGPGLAPSAVEFRCLNSAPKSRPEAWD